MIVRIASTFMSGVANSKETSGMAHGAIWGFVQIAAQKLAGALTYLVLAWLLTPSEIGLGTLSITLVAAATFIYPGAAIDSLMELVRPSSAAARAANLLAMISSTWLILVTAIFGVFAANWWGSPALWPLMVVVAVRIFVEMTASASSAQLRLALRFREIALADIVLAAVTLTFTVTLALFGAGVWAMIAPVLIGHIVRSWYLIHAAPLVPVHDGVKVAMRKMLPGFAWGGLQHSMAGLSQVVDYLAISIFCTTIALGIYTIGFQIGTMAYGFFSITIGRVAQSTFTALRGDTQAQVHFHKHIQIQAMIGAAPVGACLAAIAPILTRTVLPERMAGVEGPLAILSIAMIFANPIGICSGYLRANGRFLTLFHAQLFHTALLAVLALLGAWWMGINAVAAALLVTSVVSGIIHIVLCANDSAWITQIRIWPIKPVVTAIACFAPAAWVCWMREGSTALLGGAAFTIIGAAAYFALIRIIYPTIVGAIERTLANRLRRN